MRAMQGVFAVALTVCLSQVCLAQATTRPASTKTLPADQMLGQMLRQSAPGNESGKTLQPSSTDRPAIDKTSGSRATAPGAPSVGVMREGTYVVDRVGRLTHATEKTESEFTFESDGRALRDPPVVILPNLKLMQMENAVQASNRDLRFRITGMVTEYRGRNYVLLDKVVVVPDQAEQF